MPASSARYRVNTPNVTHQVIDGEAIMINLDKGHYYSLEGAGAEIWTLLGSNATAEEIAAALEVRHGESPGRIATAVSALIQQLRDEELIVPCQQAAAEPATLPDATQGRAFEPPILNKYVDMEDLLLLDPIHEVDDAGWPLARNDTPS